MKRKDMIMYQNDIKSHIEWLDQSIERYNKVLLSDEKSLIQERQLRELSAMKEKLSAISNNYKQLLNDNIEVFSIGGGFYQAEMPIANGSMYAVVTNDYINMLCIYKYVDEDNKYYPKDMIFCENYEDIEREDFKTICKDLHNALCEFMQSIGVSEYE